jgi:hypothetical protein
MIPEESSGNAGVSTTKWNVFVSYILNEVIRGGLRQC